MRNFRLVLMKLRDEHLYGKFNKCEFWLDQVVFFGHIISSEGICVDPKKMEPVLNWERPSNVTIFIAFWDWPDTIDVLLKDFLLFLCQ